MNHTLIMKYLVVLRFFYAPLQWSFSQLTLLSKGLPIANSQTLVLKKGQTLKIVAQLTTNDLDMDDIDRFPDGVGTWVDSTTSGGNLMIETFEWQVTNDTIFDFFDGNDVYNINFTVVAEGLETGIIDSEGAGLFSKVIVSDDLDENAIPFAGSVYKNSLPLAYAYVDSDGTLITDYGIQSVTKTGVGEYEVKLEKEPMGSPVAIVTPVNPTPRDKVATVAVAPNTDVIKVNLIYFGSTAEDGAFMIVVFGKYP